MVAYYTPQTAGEPHHAYRDSTLPCQYFSATGERDENPRNSVLVQLGNPRLGQGNLRVGSDRHVRSLATEVLPDSLIVTSAS